MPSYQIEFVKSAYKEFKRIPPETQKKFIESLQLLATNPYSEFLKTKKLRGEDKLYRIRAGDYRLVYEVQKTKLLILVIKVGHRKEVYRR